MKKTFKPVSQFISNRKLPLLPIAQKVNDLSAMNQHLQAILPLELQSNCKVANLNQDCLILCTDNASRLTVLRFHLPVLLKQLQAIYPYIKTIKCKIMPDYYPVTTKNNAAHLSSIAASTIKECAKGIEDESLQKALIKLASRTK